MLKPGSLGNKKKNMSHGYTVTYVYITYLCVRTVSDTVRYHVPKYKRTPEKTNINIYIYIYIYIQSGPCTTCLKVHRERCQSNGATLLMEFDLQLCQHILTRDGGALPLVLFLPSV